MPRYGRRSYPRAYGTRYFSTRQTPGFYRRPSYYSLKGPARRLFRRRLGGSTRASIKRVMRSVAEKKYTRVVQSMPNGDINNRIDIDGVRYQLTSVAQGITDTSRIGDKVTGTSLRFRFIFFNPGYLASTGSGVPFFRPAVDIFVRVIIFIWKDDTEPVLAQLIDQDIALPDTLETIHAPLAHDYKIKRKILYDKTHYLHSDTVAPWLPAQGGLQPPPAGSYKPMLNLMLDFDLTKLKGGLGTVNYAAGDTNVGVNNIWVWFLSSGDQTGSGSSIVNTCWNGALSTKYTFTDV